jgi:hypothetical protein
MFRSFKVDKGLANLITNMAPGPQAQKPDLSPLG